MTNITCIFQISHKNIDELFVLFVLILLVIKLTF